VKPNKLTIAEYIAAFETWARASALPDVLACILADALAHLRTAFPDDEVREPRAYCDIMERYAAELASTDPSRRNALGELHMRIRKSCLLDRLIYCGEPLRTVPCPKHKGTWGGIHSGREQCACCGSCGCTTGWLPIDAQADPAGGSK
jgi:hypothetical protein